MKYLTSYKSLSDEEIFASIVNMDLFSDIKDMALEYLDYGYRLKIKVYNKSLNGHYLIIGSIDYSHNELKNAFYISHFKKNNINELSYNAWLLSTDKQGKEYNVNKYTRELNDRIKMAYPDEIIGDYL